MDGKGLWIDNVFIERLWRTVKYEEVYRHAYRDGRKARQEPTLCVCNQHHRFDLGLLRGIGGRTRIDFEAYPSAHSA